ncbi:DUF1501 domain-containing protein [Aquipuribacter nitratireducens]|uniref:DUF1501 domain-containing protein n=1 Tax=Aquipuribacter nitratireducens TaxID=650104 RepID=A0ABW0GMN5_9MICO
MPPTTAPHPATGTCPDACSETTTAGLSRRGLLRMAAGAALGAALTTGTTLGGARVAVAATAAPADVLVVLSLRGGMDGLSLVVPSGDPDLQRWRPGIAVPGSTLKRVDGMFGLHPALAPLYPLWDAGRLGAVHACGMPAANRSHFEAMEEMEEAAPGSHLRTGWIDRMVGVAGGGSAFAATQLGSTAAPAALRGPAPEVVAQSLATLGIQVDDALPLSAWESALGHLHRSERPDVAAATQAGLAAAARAGALPPAGAGYPAGRLGTALADVARLVRADVGLRVATVDHGNWDMHSGLGSPEPGRWMYDQVATLAAALAAFAADLGPLLSRVVVVTLSEFGRRAQQNDSGRVDHGYGNAVLVLGGGVVGGRVHGRWPGLAADRLVDGDLAVTTDYRQVLAELLSVRCAVPSVTTSVFPGLVAAPLGLARRG